LYVESRPSSPERLAEAATRGDVFMSDAIEMDPPPTFRLMELRTSYEPGAGADQ
jgi:hypothetical protein